MTYRIEPLTVNFEKLTELAKAYQASYCQLSAAYKTQAEMALYTLSYFYSKYLSCSCKILTVVL